VTIRIRRLAYHRGEGWESATVSLDVTTDHGPVTIIGHGRDPADAEARARAEADRVLGRVPR
jgi:hypothetical protein